MHSKIACEITVCGRVQGVGFRYFISAVAVRLGIYGWTRNNVDGTVSILAEGTQEVLNEFISYCKRGPSFSRVEKIETKRVDFSGHKDFRVRY